MLPSRRMAVTVTREPGACSWSNSARASGLTKYDSNAIPMPRPPFSSSLVHHFCSVSNTSPPTARVSRCSSATRRQMLASCMSKMRAAAFGPMKLKMTMLSPNLLSSSGRFSTVVKWSETAVFKRCSISSYGMAGEMFCTRRPVCGSSTYIPRFEVKIRIDSEKCTVLPRPSVSRPSSRICRNLSKMRGCAFSISSNKITRNGSSRTALVSSPPASCPTYPGGEPMSRSPACSAENSLMSKRRQADDPVGHALLAVEYALAQVAAAPRVVEHTQLVRTDRVRQVGEGDIALLGQPGHLDHALQSEPVGLLGERVARLGGDQIGPHVGDAEGAGEQASGLLPVAEVRPRHGDLADVLVAGGQPRRQIAGPFDQPDDRVVERLGPRPVNPHRARGTGQLRAEAEEVAFGRFQVGGGAGDPGRLVDHERRPNGSFLRAGHGGQMPAQRLERGLFVAFELAQQPGRRSAGLLGRLGVTAGVDAQPVHRVVHEHAAVAAGAQRLPEQVAQRQQLGRAELVGPRSQEAVVQVAGQDVQRMHRKRGVQLPDEGRPPQQPPAECRLIDAHWSLTLLVRCVDGSPGGSPATSLTRQARSRLIGRSPFSFAAWTARPEARRPLRSLGRLAPGSLVAHPSRSLRGRLARRLAGHFAHSAGSLPAHWLLTLLVRCVDGSPGGSPATSLTRQARSRLIGRSPFSFAAPPGPRDERGS